LTSGILSSKTDNMDSSEITEAIESADPATGLRASIALHRLGERIEARHVTLARREGWSWQEIGDALGVTRQSVHAKYGKDIQ
jgi:DNA-directed RNA polymerase specialized sigma24 family protein